MLKIMFLDLIPYIVDDKVIYNNTWKTMLGSKYNEYLKQDESLQEIFKKNFLYPEVQNEMRKLMDDELRMQSLINNFKKTMVEVENRYFSAFSLPTPIKNLIEDAKDNDCNIVIVSTNNEYLHRAKWALDYSNVDFYAITETTHLNAEMLCTYTCNKNTCVHEFLCITQERDTINDLIQKDFFCATISKVDYSKGINPYIFSSFQDLDFETLRFNFIEVISDESEDL